jgi:hypothetical protein
MLNAIANQQAGIGTGMVLPSGIDLPPTWQANAQQSQSASPLYSTNFQVSDRLDTENKEHMRDVTGTINLKFTDGAGCVTRKERIDRWCQFVKDYNVKHPGRQPLREYRDVFVNPTEVKCVGAVIYGKFDGEWEPMLPDDHPQNNRKTVRVPIAAGDVTLEQFTCVANGSGKVTITTVTSPAPAAESVFRIASRWRSSLNQLLRFGTIILMDLASADTLTWGRFLFTIGNLIYTNVIPAEEARVRSLTEKISRLELMMKELQYAEKKCPELVDYFEVEQSDLELGSVDEEVVMDDPPVIEKGRTPSRTPSVRDESKKKK